MYEKGHIVQISTIGRDLKSLQCISHKMPLKYKTGKALSGLFQSAKSLIVGKDTSVDDKKELPQTLRTPYIPKWPAKLPAIDPRATSLTRRASERARVAGTVRDGVSKTQVLYSILNPFREKTHVKNAKAELCKRGDKYPSHKGPCKGARPEVTWAYHHYSEACLKRTFGDEKEAMKNLQEAREILKLCRRDEDADMELQTAMCTHGEMSAFEGDVALQALESTGRRPISSIESIMPPSPHTICM